MAFVLLSIGLLLLVLSGDLLVKGAVALSLRLGIPALIVSVTIVGFGTSAPEMLIAVQSALSGAPGIALGNVVGSNTANVLLVLGVPAIIYPMDTNHFDTRRIYLMMIAVSVVFIALAFTGPLYIWHGFVLLALLALMLGDNLRAAMRHSGDKSTPRESHIPVWRMSAYIIAGIVGLPIGAQLMINGAIVVAHKFGLSEEIIGLTLVAVGTSLPELATTIMAALRRQADVALGNVIGSNMFNILAIMGVASFFGPLPISPEFLHVDLWIMLGASLLIGLFIFTRLSITRLWGVAFIGLYVVYTLYLLQR